MTIPVDLPTQWCGSPPDCRRIRPLIWRLSIGGSFPGFSAGNPGNLAREGRPWAEYRIQRSIGAADAGRVLGNWGEVRVGAFHEWERGRPRIGIPGFPDEDWDRAGFKLGLRVDTENSTVFPSTGMLLDASYLQSGLGSDVEFERISAVLQSSRRFGKLAFNTHLEYGENLIESPSFFDLFFLGGPGRLSGLGTDELWGDRIALARLGLQWELKNIAFSSFHARFFLGASLEAGNTFIGESPMTVDGLRSGGSVYLAAETPIGPLFFGTGVTENGRSRVYLAIGDHY